MSGLLTLWNAMLQVLITTDKISFAIFVVVAVVAGFSMRKATTIVIATCFAFLLFVLLNFMWGITIGGQNPRLLAPMEWQAFSSMQIAIIMAYVVIMISIIFVSSVIRQIITR